MPQDVHGSSNVRSLRQGDPAAALLADAPPRDCTRTREEEDGDDGPLSIRRALALLHEFDWCDTSCARCLLEDRCLVRVRDRQRQWAADMRGVERDWSQEIIDDLERCREVLEKTAEEEGIDRSVPVPEPARSLFAIRFSGAGRAYAFALARYHGAPDGTPEAEASDAAPLIAMKTARIFDALAPDGTPALRPDRPDAMLSSLLLDIVERRAGDALEALADHADPEIVAARARFRPLFDAILASIPSEVREWLDDRIRAGEAPSPFAVRSSP